jgi:hypothetical protein
VGHKNCDNEEFHRLNPKATTTRIEYGIASNLEAYCPMFTYLIVEDGNLRLTSPSGEEKYLYGEDKQYFLDDVGYLEESDLEVERKISDLIENYYWSD